MDGILPLLWTQDSIFARRNIPQDSNTFYILFLYFFFSINIWSGSLLPALFFFLKKKKNPVQVKSGQVT